MRTGRPSINLLGQKCGRLLVLQRVHNLGRDRAWECLCDCGNVVIARAFALRSGNTKSCGCLKRDATVKRNIETGVKKRLANPPKPITRSDSRTFGELAFLFAELKSVEVVATAGWKGRSGIYALINKVTGKLYVGSASCLKGRLSYHWSKLRNGKHDNSYLQHSWYSHGESAFITVVIEECPISSLMEREGFWMAKTKSTDKAFGYNLDTIAVRKMHSAETKAKIAAGNLGKKRTLEQRKNISIAKMGISTGKRTPEQRLNYSRAAKGRKWSEESKARQSLIRKGKQLPTEWVQNARKGWMNAFLKKKQEKEKCQLLISGF